MRDFKIGLLTSKQNVKWALQAYLQSVMKDVNAFALKTKQTRDAMAGVGSLHGTQLTGVRQVLYPLTDARHERRPTHQHQLRSIRVCRRRCKFEPPMDQV